MDTPEQAYFISSDFDLLCLALPGAGKTYSTIKLSGSLLKKDSSYKVLLITFTKSAANEMNERLEGEVDALDILTERVRASTFDSMQNKQAKQLSRFKKRTLAGGEMGNFIFRCINSYSEVVDYDDATRCIDQFGHYVELPTCSIKGYNFDAVAFYQHYLSMLEVNRFTDFSIISRKVCLAMEQGKIDLDGVTHLIVDEYQDSCPVQYRWIKAYRNAGVKIIVVGDDDQAIYGFRTQSANLDGLSNEDVFTLFNKDFNPAVCMLSRCFRCRPEILKLAERLISHNVKRIDKEMIAVKEPGGKVLFRGYKTKDDELDAIARHVSEFNDGYAILCRTQRELSDLEVHLSAHNVEYERIGSKSLWDNPAADYMLKFYWSTFKQKDFRFIGEILGHFQETESVIQFIITNCRKKTLFSDVIIPDSLNPLNVTLKLQSLFKDYQTDTLTYHARKKRIQTVSDLVIRNRQLKETSQEFKIIHIIGDILNKMKCKREFSYHDRVEILGKNLAPKSNASNDDDNQIVKIMTMHSSKGLQFNSVWLPNCVETSIPSKRSIETDYVNGTNDAVEEERRLFFVAITRAVHRIHISFNHDFSKSDSNPVSRFVGEADSAAYDKAVKMLHAEYQIEQYEDLEYSNS
ncbi:3'-5' exonuclease [Moritella sp. F3]|uniref:3'-5' exonuclease n=1 Tax=Moritella sp. F3 TaxID=2718882 RepID=UPI0018E1055F|nr:ATP-dependent helicase [Moritella sp. F3]GIC77050.1 DNA helicase [Moritella sp. F1]GIC82169.1 DNA helicase [Moritella sp. F3]